MYYKQYTRHALFAVTLVMFVTIATRNVKYVTQGLTSWKGNTLDVEFLLERGPSEEWIRKRTVINASTEQHGTINHDESQNVESVNR